MLLQSAQGRFTMATTTQTSVDAGDWHVDLDAYWNAVWPRRHARQRLLHREAKLHAGMDAREHHETQGKTPTRRGIAERRPIAFGSP
jgi:hypothetical protein